MPGAHRQPELIFDGKYYVCANENVECTSVLRLPDKRIVVVGLWLESMPPQASSIMVISPGPAIRQTGFDIEAFLAPFGKITDLVEV